jgi:hypothetical protein
VWPATSGYSLQEICVKFGLALFAVIVIVVDLIFCHEAHAWTVLPDLAALALNHKLPCVWIIL